jgi:hypothetical protein
VTSRGIQPISRSATHAWGAARLAPLLLAFPLASCSSTASDAEQALLAREAPDLAAGLAACPPGDRGCGVEVVVRFGAWEACARLEHPGDDECRFRQAEALERAGDGAAALDLCAGNVYESGCATHVVGQEARRAETMDEAVGRWEGIMSHTNTRYNHAYWRAWWRSRIDAGQAPSVESCRSEPCRRAAEQEIEATVDALAVPCAALDREPPGWIAEGSARAIAAWHGALSHTCVPDAEHPVPKPLPPGPRGRPPTR